MSSDTRGASEPAFELQPRDWAEVTLVVGDQCHAERERMRGYLGIELADRGAVALEGGVQLAVSGSLVLAEGRDREGDQESVDQR